MMWNDLSKPGTRQTGNVIAMSTHRTENRFRHVAEVEAYWHALRGSRLVPRRSEVDPRGIERALEYAFILERVAPGVGRLRIAGGHLGDLLGMEVRGMPLSAFVMPEARPMLAASLDMVCDSPCIVTLSLAAETGIGKPVLDARLALLPLSDEFGQVNRMLGCLDSQGSIGRGPRRFSIAARRLTRIEGQPYATATPQSSRDLPAMSGFAEEMSRFSHGAQSIDVASKDAGAATGSSRATHLRLVKSDR